MEEGSFGDVVGVGSEREGGVKDDSEVADLGGGGDDGAIDVEVWAERVRCFGPIIRISDLLQLSLRKFCCIHDFISARQVVREEWVTEVMVLQEK